MNAGLKANNSKPSIFSEFEFFYLQNEYNTFYFAVF